MRGALAHISTMVAVAACAGAAPEPHRVPPPPAPVEPQPASTSSAAPSGSASPSPNPPEEPPSVCTVPLEQACVPGCIADSFDCGESCVQACGGCVNACGGKPSCVDACAATRDRCVTGTCGRKRRECELEWAKEKKRNFGCKTRPLAKACEELNACLYEGDPPANEAGRRIDSCAAKTGCSRVMAVKIWWGGGNVGSEQLVRLLDDPG